MIFTNTFKLTLNNGNLIWKILLYLLVCFVIVCGIALGTCYSLIQNLVKGDIFNQLLDLISNSFLNFNLGDICYDISVILTNLVGIIISNQLIPLVILLFVIVGLVGGFLVGLAQIPATNCIYGYMGSFSKLGFCGCMIEKIVLSIKFALSRLVVIIPYDIVSMFVLYGVFQIYGLGSIAKIITPFVLISAIVLLIAIRVVLFGMWPSSIIVKGNNIWHGLLDSTKCLAKDFKRLFAGALVLTLIALTINIIVAIFTSCVGLLLTIPTTILAFYIYSQVSYFYTNGLRYYIDKQTIVTPSSIEDFEKINKIRNII